MRRVLHLKMVTQCAMLEDFGIFLVLADKVSITGKFYMGYQDIDVMSLVAIRVSHRGFSAVVTSEPSHLTDTTKIEWQQRCSFLQCWPAQRTDTGYLHEEERSKLLVHWISTCDS